MTRTQNHFLVLLSMIGFVSCDPTTTAKRATSSTTSTSNTGTYTTNPSSGGGIGGTPVGSGGGINSDCYANGVGDQATDYFTFDEIVQKGKPAGDVAWSSATDSRLSGQQNLFKTDSRFNVRIMAKPSPGKGSFPGGVSCYYAALPYTKLKVKARLRLSTSSTAYKSYTFDNIQVDSCSNVFEFKTPPSSQPWVIELMDVQWDYSCIAYTQGGFPDVPQCPWDYVWANDCYELSVQWATDYTRDIPH